MERWPLPIQGNLPQLRDPLSQLCLPRKHSKGMLLSLKVTLLLYLISAPNSPSALLAQANVIPTPGDNPTIPRPDKIVKIQVQMGLGTDRAKYKQIQVHSSASILQRSSDMRSYSAGSAKSPIKLFSIAPWTGGVNQRIRSAKRLLL